MARHCRPVDNVGRHLTLWWHCRPTMTSLVARVPTLSADIYIVRRMSADIASRCFDVIFVGGHVCQCVKGGDIVCRPTMTVVGRGPYRNMFRTVRYTDVCSFLVPNFIVLSLWVYMFTTKERVIEASPLTEIIWLCLLRDNWETVRDNKSSQRPHTSSKENLVVIRSPSVSGLRITAKI